MSVNSLSSQEMWRVTMGAAVGTVIEWYGFALYGIVAGLVLNDLFFPTFSPAAGTLAAFAGYAVGSFARPIGGVVLGSLADRYGRKPILLFSLSLMGISTVLIGVLPTYATAGFWAPILLVLLLIAQGFGAGAELAGGITFVAEYAPVKRRGFFTAITCAMTSGGLLLASGAFAIISALTTDEQFAAWGWRIPFLISIVFLGIALYVRNRLSETPAFLAEVAAGDRPHMPILQVFRERPRDLFMGFLSISGLNSTGSLVDTFAAGFIVATLGMSTDTATWALVCAAIAGMICTPFFGWLSDIVGRRRVMITGCVFMIAFAYPFFAMLESRNITLIVLAMALAYGIGLGATFGPQGAFLAELFETRFRQTGISVAREFNGVALSGLTPLVASGLIMLAGGGAGYVIGFLVLWQGVAIVGLAFAKGAIAPTRRSDFTTADRAEQMSLAYDPDTGKTIETVTANT
jgi:MFS transporter, MHS family, shikimate and dehydroshikimate transport protein